MRRSVALIAALALVASLGAAPAVAGKKKKVKVHETFSATLAPFPKDENWAGAGFTRPGCTSGEQDVHWVAVAFKSPGKGDLRLYMEDFQGDHDIYIFESETVFHRGDQAQVGQSLAPPEESITVQLRKGQKVTLVACNWAGHPEVVAHYEGTFKT